MERRACLDASISLDAIGAGSRTRCLAVFGASRFVAAGRIFLAILSSLGSDQLSIRHDRNEQR
jgi:hypothetical protein